MTVSPKWPQDGNRQPNQVGRGVQSDDSSREPALPPTLFALRNLNPAAPVAPEPTPATQTPASPAPQTTQTREPEVLSPPVSTLPTPKVSESRDGDRKSDDQPRSPTPPAVAHTTATLANAPVTARRVDPQPDPIAVQPSKSPLPWTTVSSTSPVARSWMETLGSHGVIAVLLLLVVAAALVTGRDSGDPESDASLAEYGELVDFDEGAEVDLPLPAHDLDSATQVATPINPVDPSSSVADLPVNPAKSTDELSSLAAADPTDAERTAAMSMDVPSVALDSSASDAATEDSVVSLNAPQATSANSNETVQQPGFGVEPPAGVQINEFTTAPATADVMAVANRTAAKSRTPDLPSLEELTGVDSDGRPNAASQTGPTRIYSKTPAGISDWSKYLPGFQPAVAADAEIPSTPNELLTK